jgi:hypothetical protein
MGRRGGCEKWEYWRMRKIGGRGLFEIEEKGRKRWVGGIGDGRERSMGRRGGWKKGRKGRI